MFDTDNFPTPETKKYDMHIAAISGICTAAIYEHLAKLHRLYFAFGIYGDDGNIWIRSDIAMLREVFLEFEFRQIMSALRKLKAAGWLKIEMRPNAEGNIRNHYALIGDAISYYNLPMPAVN